MNVSPEHISPGSKMVYKVIILLLPIPDLHFRGQSYSQKSTNKQPGFRMRIPATVSRPGSEASSWMKICPCSVLLAVLHHV